MKELNSKGNELTFEFTESDAQLQFNRQDKNIFISSNYCDVKSTVSLIEFNDAVTSYAEHVLNEALNAYPALKANSSFQTWYPIRKTPNM